MWLPLPVSLVKTAIFVYGLAIFLAPVFRLDAGVLFLLGSFIWFIPPLAARSLGIDLASQFPHLAKPGEAAYAAIAIVTLPPGMLGLLVIGLIASTTDQGLNNQAGMFVRGLYRPVLRPLCLSLPRLRLPRRVRTSEVFYLPPDRANGTAVMICPVGGYNLLAGKWRRLKSQNG
jgi:hypothetical protein